MLDKKTHLFLIIKNAFLYSIGIVLAQFINFLLIPIYTRLLNVAEYGLLGIIQITQAIVVIILSLGLTNALSRIYYDNQSTTEKQKFTASIFWLLTCISIGSAIFLSALAKIFHPPLFSEGTDNIIIYYLIISIAVTVITNTCLAFLQIRMLPKTYSAAQLINVFLYNTVSILLVKMGLGIIGILIAGIIAAAASFGFILYFIKVDVRISNYDNSCIRILIHSGIPLLFLSVVAWVIDLSDRYFLNHFISTFEVGLYTLSNQIVAALALVNAIFMSAVPIYLFKVREENKSLGEHLQTESFRYYSIIALFISLALSLFAKDIVSLLAPPAYFRAHQFISLLSFSQFFLGGFYILHVGIANAKKFHYLLICFTMSGCANVLLNIWLIPRYAAFGAALATAISYFVLMALGNIYSQRLYYLRWNYRTPTILFISVVTLLYANSFMPNNNSPQTFFVKTTSLFLFLVVIWRVGLLRDERGFLKNLLQLKRQS